jgi:glycosyltransferase involved in cell wall biosynthesis
VKSPLHILIVDHVSTLGGAEFSLEGLVTSMPQDKYKYSVALPSPGPLVDRLYNKSIKVDLMPVESWRWWIKTKGRILKFWLLLPLQLVSLGRWISYLRKQKPDIVHANINRLVEPVIASRLLGIPTVMHFRDIPSRMSYRFVLGKKGFYWLMNSARYWIANSLSTYDDIHLFSRRPVVIIPNAIDLVHFDKMSFLDTPTPGNHCLKVAMIAGLVPLKNHPAYIKLAKMICDKRDDVEFLIAGVGQQAYTSELKQLADNLHLNGRVKFLGFIENIPALLRTVAMLVHTTESESFGRVFIEAMAARCPVVAYDSGGAKEIVVNGETGILVPLGDLEAMAQAICQLLDHPTTRQQMGEAGRKRVEKNYTLDKHCQAVSMVYDQLLASLN